MTTDESAGYIGEDLVLRGRLSGTGDLHVAGRVDGDIELSGTLTLGPAAVVRAPVRASNLDVAGFVRGGVTATGCVSIAAGGCVEGDVLAEEVVIAEGGALHGAIQMDFEVPETEL